MSNTTDDAWTAWLDDQRFSGGEQEERLKETLHEYRETVLDHADLADDDTVLDVGAGDGLIGFGALERLGPEGTVIFSDISEVVLERARTTATELELMDQCEFVIAPAEELEPIDDESVDAVTLRSVLIFVEEKERAFAEFERVLKPGGRLSIYEPIGDFTRETIERTSHSGDSFLQYDLERTEIEIPDAIRDLYSRVEEYGRDETPDRGETWMFGERDLFVFAENAGFEDIDLKLHAYHTRYYETEEWGAWLTTSFGPGSPTKEEAIDAVLTAEERETFTEHVRPLIESRAPKVARGTPAYLWATKPDR